MKKRIVGGGLNSLITFLNGVVDSKAPIDSPIFVGTPTAPTPNISDNSTKLATTEFVNSKISKIMFDRRLITMINGTGTCALTKNVFERNIVGVCTVATSNAQSIRYIVTTGKNCTVYLATAINGDVEVSFIYLSE